MRYSSLSVLPEGTEPRDRCAACGHFALHHDYYAAPRFHHTIGCNWRGCGCPAFVPSSQEVEAGASDG